MGRTGKLDAAQQEQLAELLAKGHSQESAAEWFTQRGTPITRGVVETFQKKQRRTAAALVTAEPGGTPPDVVEALERRRKELAKLAAAALKREAMTTYIDLVTEERKHAELLLRASGAKKPDGKTASPVDASAVLKKIQKLTANARAERAETPPEDPIH